MHYAGYVVVVPLLISQCHLFIPTTVMSMTKSIWLIIVEWFKELFDEDKEGFEPIQMQAIDASDFS